MTIRASAIRAGCNDRKSFNPQKLAELAESIKRFGLAQPPTLRPIGSGIYEVVAGERRIRAMRDILGWTEINAQVVELNDEQASAVMLLENTGRDDLNPIEEAAAYKARIENFEWTVDETAKAAGVSKAQVNNRLRLLELSPDIQEVVRVKVFPANYAIKIAHLDPNRQRFLMHHWKQNPSMGMIRWRDMVRKSTDEMGLERQGDFFELVNPYGAEKDGRPWKGKAAITGVAIGNNVPAVQVGKDDRMAAIFDRYVRRLREKGEGAAAEAVGNVYNCFVYKGWVTVTGDTILPDQDPDVGTVEDQVHIEHL